MDFVVIIPARYGSTRFPGKPLALINNKPMVQHVHERALEAGASQVIVATDDIRISEVVKRFGGELCMTRDDHDSGTERLAEVIEQYGFADDCIVVNVQGDEPFIPSDNIQQVARNLHQNTQVPMATLAYPIADIEDLFNPNVVKVLSDKHKLALYFSRAPIPYDRDAFAEILSSNRSVNTESGEAADTSKNLLSGLNSEYLRHIGIYGYRAGFVKQYINMQPSVLEKTESLEQLRVLWHGHRIHVDVALSAPPHGVDTPDDLARLQGHTAV